MTLNFLIWPLLTIGAQSQTVDQPDWARADAETVRLVPSKFVNLPVGVREELERRGCAIPQPYAAKSASNVITGRFTSSTTIDWAVLCSRERTSTILVFRAGSTSDIAEFANRADADFLQGTGTGDAGFSRGLSVADPGTIRIHYEAYGGPQLPPLDHDGIDDAFLGKVSVIHYWHEGHWLQLQGAD